MVSPGGFEVSLLYASTASTIIMKKRPDRPCASFRARIMRRDHDEVALLLADITGSTPLYENVGDAAAARQIDNCLNRLRSIANQEGGTFIRSKGDDMLCAFADPVSALKAARLMLSQHSTGPLAVHAGVHFGRIIRTREDVFGDAVNLTARLATIAKPGEVLASRSFLDQLSEPDTRFFRVLDSMTFKGKSAPTEVYSLLEDTRAARTEMAVADDLRPQLVAPEMLVVLRYGIDSWQCKGRAIVSIGRSPECDLVIGQPWISRKHATVTLRRGKVQLDDRSSSGTYIMMRDGQELFIRRETALLTGSGIISPAMRPTDAGAAVIHYEINCARRDLDVES